MHPGMGVAGAFTAMPALKSRKRLPSNVFEDSALTAAHHQRVDAASATGSDAFVLVDHGAGADPAGR